MDAGPEDMLYMRTLIANVVFVGEPGSDDWVLVDAGVYTFADNIADTAKKTVSFRSAASHCTDPRTL